jgi:hypothetical protein
MLCYPGSVGKPFGELGAMIVDISVITSCDYWDFLGITAQPRAVLFF